MIDQRQLIYFLRVAASGSFSRASIDLDIAQPALSRAIRKLEAKLGSDLFYRTGRGVNLTPQGEVLMRRSQPILQELEALGAEVAAMGKGLSGTATVGFPPTVGRTMSLQLAHLFRDEHLSVRLRIVEGLSGNVLEWLYTGKIDVGVLYARPPQRIVAADPLVDEDLVLITAPDFEPPHTSGRVAMRDLVSVPLVLPSPHHGLRGQIERVAEQLGLRLQIILEIDALFSMIEAVRQGMGATILPRASVQRDLQDGAVRVWPITDPSLCRTLYIATASQRGKAISIQRIAQIVRAEMLKLVPLGVWRPHRPEAAAGHAPPH